MDLPVNDTTLSVEEALVQAMIAIGDGTRGARRECIDFLDCLNGLRDHIATVQHEGVQAPISMHRLHDRAERFRAGIDRRLMGRSFAA